MAKEGRGTKAEGKPRPIRQEAEKRAAWERRSKKEQCTQKKGQESTTTERRLVKKRIKDINWKKNY